MDVWRILEWAGGLTLTAALAAFGWLETKWRGRIEEDILEIRKDLEEYKGNCGVGKVAMQKLQDTIEAHVQREEGILWEEVRADRKLNLAVHEKLVGALDAIGNRMTRVETILDERLPAKVAAKPARRKRG